MSDHDVLCSGVLWKAPSAKGNDKLRRGWRKRWFVLRRDALEYYKSKQQAESDKGTPKGRLSLSNCAVIDAEELIGIENTFKVSDFGQRVYLYAKAPTVIDKFDWIVALQNAISVIARQTLSNPNQAKPKQLRMELSSFKDRWLGQTMNHSFMDMLSSHATYDGALDADGKRHGYGILKSNTCSYEGEWSNNLADGFGVFQHISGMRYEGQWIDGKQQGQGSLSFSNGSMYIGDWYQGKRHGNGIWLTGSGCKYEGEFINGRQEGHGLLIWPNGNEYEGDFEDNKGHGKGTLKYHDGTVYRGGMKYGMLNGDGELTFTNGRTYKGAFMNDKYFGEGELHFEDGSVYSGDCQFFMREGHGVMKWASGDEYEGQWFEDAMHGKGSHTMAVGHAYHGDFVKGLRDGYGIMRFKDFKVYDGEWRQGKMHGKGTMRYPNGNCYEGSWLQGRKHGHGVYSWTDGSSFDGMYASGKPCGKGRFSHVNGTLYKGDYVDGQRSGNGELILPTGTRFRGMFQRNDRNGFGIAEYIDGSRYEGLWTNDKRGPKGIYVSPDGHYFQGLFVNGDFAAGQIQYSNGNRYEGEVHPTDRLKRHGVGVMLYRVGERIEGHFYDDEPDGFCVVFLIDGRVTEGTYMKGKCIKILIRKPHDYEHQVMVKGGEENMNVEVDLSLPQFHGAKHLATFLRHIDGWDGDLELQDMLSAPTRAETVSSKQAATKQISARADDAVEKEESVQEIGPVPFRRTRAGSIFHLRSSIGNRDMFTEEEDAMYRTRRRDTIVDEEMQVQTEMEDVLNDAPQDAYQPSAMSGSDSLEHDNPSSGSDEHMDRDFEATMDDAEPAAEPPMRYMESSAPTELVHSFMYASLVKQKDPDAQKLINAEDDAVPVAHSMPSVGMHRLSIQSQGSGVAMSDRDIEYFEAASQIIDDFQKSDSLLSPFEEKSMTLDVGSPTERIELSWDIEEIESVSIAEWDYQMVARWFELHGKTRLVPTILSKALDGSFLSTMDSSSLRYALPEVELSFLECHAIVGLVDQLRSKQKARQSSAHLDASSFEHRNSVAKLRAQLSSPALTQTPSRESMSETTNVNQLRAFWERGSK